MKTITVQNLQEFINWFIGEASSLEPIQKVKITGDNITIMIYRKDR